MLHEYQLWRDSERRAYERAYSAWLHSEARSKGAHPPVVPDLSYEVFMEIEAGKHWMGM